MQDKVPQSAYNRNISHEDRIVKRLPDPDARIVGSRLRVIRESVNLTQKDVAARLGMSDGGYSSIERGHARMFVTDIPRVAQAFGVQPAYLSRRLGLCGNSEPDLAQSLVETFGPQLGQTLVRLDRILAYMEHGDTDALTVTIRRHVEPYEAMHL